MWKSCSKRGHIFGSVGMETVVFWMHYLFMLLTWLSFHWDSSNGVMKRSLRQIQKRTLKRNATLETLVSVALALILSGFKLAISYLYLMSIIYATFLKHYPFLFHIYECFSVKYATRIFHMKLHPGHKWHIFHILTSEDIADVIPLFGTL